MAAARTVIYVAPFPGIRATHRFGRALASLPGVRLLGLFQERPSAEVARIYDDFEVVGSALDARQLLLGAERLRARHGSPDRIVGVLEDVQVQLAQLRRHYGLPGGDVAAAQRFRDKGEMKQALRSHGIPCARDARLRSDADAWAFAKAIGFPLVLKPPAGSGCRATYRCDDAASLQAALSEVRPSPHREVLAEEFLSGSEYSFETLTVAGRPVFHSISRYLPGPLEVTKNPWMQWVCVLPRRIDTPDFDRAREVGFAAVQRLGMVSGMTHMEWFRRPDGSVAVGEIAMRPPGAQFVSLMSWAHDVDMYRAWAEAAALDVFRGPYERGWAVSIAYLRGQGQGRVAAVENLDRAQREVGSLVVETQLPGLGKPRSPHYEGDGYVILRHRDTDTVIEATRRLISTVRVTYR
jgi:formate-dependent phosphoribosylglycinamide formyltransferase (GAR transformylase)